MSNSDRPISQLPRQPVDTRVRLAVGLGDPERERALLPALHALSDFVVVERCLAADQVLDCVREGRADAALLAFDLHRLSRTMLTELRQSRVALVVLAPDPDQDPWRSLPGVTVSLEADAATLERALTAALRGERPARIAHDEPSAPDPVPQPSSPSQSALSVLAVAGGHGSPGRTTVALNLAVALGAVAPTVLVDADLANPSLAVHLDADPTRNLYMLAHAEPDTPHEWDLALDQEVQPLVGRSPHAVVLCGLPKPDLRGRLSLPFFERLLAQLRQRYRYVILDVGADLQGSEVVAHRVALAQADQTLLVVAADLVGLRQGQLALAHFTDSLGLSREGIALILNRHDRRHHYSRTEIEWTLGLPTAAVIPYDYRPFQRALDRQQPLLLAGKSRAGRALLDLAERLYGGQVTLPPETSERRWPWQRRATGARERQDLVQALGQSHEGGSNGHLAVLDGSLAQSGRERPAGRARPTRRGARGRQPPAE